MGGGLPTFSGFHKKLGMSKSSAALLSKFDSIGSRLANIVAESTRPPKPAEFPEVKPIAPPPTISMAEEAGEEARRKQPRGRRGTFLTGDVVPDLSPRTGKKRLLFGV